MIGVDFIEHMDSLKIIDCLRGKAWPTQTKVAPFGNCNKFLFYNQKSIAKRPPPNTLINYYTVLSEHVHYPENYVRQVLDARDELPDIKEAFNALQMNTNLQNMFAIRAAAVDGFELNISAYDKKKIKEFENSIVFKGGCYYVDLPWTENKVNRVLSNFHVAFLTSLRKNKLEAYNEVFFQQKKGGIIERWKIQPEEFEKFIWIPHRSVIKNSEQVTTKVRLVFNCSLKTYGNFLKWSHLYWNQFD